MRIIFPSLVLTIISFNSLFAQDHVPPEIKINYHTLLEFGPDGTAILTPEQVDNGTTDNITTQANLKFSLNKTEFNCSDISTTEEWQVLDGASFPAVTADGQVLAFSPDGTPYVSYTYVLNGGDYHFDVRKWNGTGWESLGGAAGSVGRAVYRSLAISPDGTPYIAYSDALNDHKAIVKKWNGSSWEALGGTEISEGSTSYHNIKIAGDGTIYVGYQEYVNESKTIVKKWNGTTWEALSSEEDPNGIDQWHKFAISPDGTPFVAYNDFANGIITKILKWNGSNWEAFGGEGIATRGTVYSNLSISPEGYPYIAYGDDLNEGKITVMKWNGTAWEALGGEGISAGYAYFLSLSISQDGTPYVAYGDYHNEVRTTVLKWNGSSWEVLGGAAISDGQAFNQHISISPDGTPYVTYQNNHYKTTVQKYYQSNRVILTVEDEAGNKAVAGTLVNVKEGPGEAPLAVAKDVAVVLGANGIATVTAEMVNNGSTDNCTPAGDLQLSLEGKTSFTTADLGPNTVTLKVEDSGGNFSRTTATVTVVDGMPPTAKAVPSVSIVLDENGGFTLDPASINSGSSDYISPAESLRFSLSKASFDCSDVAVTEGWRPVGSAGISAGPAVYQSLVISPEGTLYVAYQDRANGEKTTVMRWSGAAWEALGGPGISAGAAENQVLALSPDGILYIAYRDLTKMNRTTVMKWNGTGWEVLGGPGFSAGEASNISLAIGPDGTPYVAYGDKVAGNKTTVMKWDGSSWEALGGPGVSVSEALGQNLAIGPDGAPYVAFMDSGVENKTVVIKWNGSSWETLGGAGISAGLAFNQNMVIAPDGTPYVAYEDLVNENKTEVMKWNGSSWEAVGVSGIPRNLSSQSALSFSSDGTPYVAYKDYANKLRVVKWDGTNWEPIGGAGLPIGVVTYYSLEVSPDGTPYVAFLDSTNGGKTTVQKYYQSNRIALIVEDEAGNKAVAGTLVNVKEGPGEAPLAVAKDVAVVLGANGIATVTAEMVNNGSTDNCTPAGDLQLSLEGKTSFTTADLGPNTVTLKVEDSGGNFSRTTATVTLVDGMPPTAKAVPSVSIELDENGGFTLDPASINSGSSDDISSAESLRFSLSKASFDCSDVAVTEGWRPVGDEGFSIGRADNQRIAVSPDGALYVAYQDKANGEKTTVMRWSGAAWEALGGPGISAGATEYQNMAVSPDGIPYVAFQDLANDYKTTVMMWNGASWEALGGPGISAGTAVFQSLAISPDGSPYIAFADKANDHKTTVMKWNGNAWEALGGAGFSEGSAGNQSLAISPDGTPYLAFQDGAIDSKTTVVKWNGNAWEVMGRAGITDNVSNNQSLAISPDGIPYIASTVLYPNTSKTVLMKWNGSSWETVGGTGFSLSSTLYQKLAISPDGTPYLAFMTDLTFDLKTAVRKWNGTKWENVGSAGMSKSSAEHQSIAISPDGTIYVAYRDDASDYKTTVQQFYRSNHLSLIVEDEAGNKAVTGTFVTVVDKLPPLNVHSKLEMIREQDYTTLLTADSLAFSDNCSPATEVTYNITRAPEHGRIALESNPESIITSFTQEQLNNEEVVYVYLIADLDVPDSFEFTISDGAGNTSSPHTFDLLINWPSTSGLFKNATAGSAITVYPNPTTGGVVIKLEGAERGEKLELALYDAEGRLLLKEQGSLEQASAKVNLFLQDARLGIYLLRVKGQGGLESIRIIRI